MMGRWGRGKGGSNGQKRRKTMYCYENLEGSGQVSNVSESLETKIVHLVTYKV